jgi:hypothetical protein
MAAPPLIAHLKADGVNTQETPIEVAAGLRGTLATVAISDARPI